MNKKSNKLSIVILIILCIISLMPYLVMCLCCFSTSLDIKGGTLLSNLSWQNFCNNVKIALGGTPLIKSIINSFLVSVTASLFGIMISSMGAYSYVFQKLRNTLIWFYLTIYAMYIPEATLLIPSFLLFKELGLLNTFFAVVIVSLSIPFLMYLFKQNALLISKDIIRSARMDGASEFSIFFRVFIPAIRDVIIAAFLISFFNAWNSVMLPVVILQSQSKFTNSIYLNSLGSIWFGDYAVLMVSIVISTLPILMLFLIFQRYIKKITNIN